MVRVIPLGVCGNYPEQKGSDDARITWQHDERAITKEQPDEKKNKYNKKKNRKDIEIPLTTRICECFRVKLRALPSEVADYPSEFSLIDVIFHVSDFHFLFFISLLLLLKHLSQTRLISLLRRDSNCEGGGGGGGE